MGYTPPENQKVAAFDLLMGVKPDGICQKVCDRCDVTWEQMFSPGRGLAREAEARAIAMYLLRIGKNWGQERIGAYFRRHYSSVASATERVKLSGPLTREAMAIVDELKGVQTSAKQIRQPNGHVPLALRN